MERIAVGDQLNSPGAQVLDEPWATAWRLIEEFWSSPASEEGPSIVVYGTQKRLRARDRSGAIVSAIVDLVAPRLKIEPIDSWRWQVVKKPHRPKTFNHLLSARLTSGNLIDLNVLELAELSEVPFLNALAKALEATINHGLDLAHRLGWDGQRGLWKLGNLGRVYYVASDGSNDPDTYHHGIAPSVKLLHAVVARIADLEAKAALPFVQRWRIVDSLVHIRLWAAIARNSKLIAAEELGAFLRGLNDRQFWDLDVFPEVADLRALRFGDLGPETRKAIARRLRKGPPRDHWPRKADAAKVKNARLYWAVREIKRIDIASNSLPQDARAWMEANIAQLTYLGAMAIDDGFPKASEAYLVPPNPDARRRHPFACLGGRTFRSGGSPAAQSASRGKSCSGAAPFLRDVWPQERSLATPGVSSALSDLPATSDEAFAEAVEAIDRFLVPFECWSTVNYGLYGDDGETKKLTIIDDDTKANALLRLLDLTIGSSERAVVPHDLTDALDQIGCACSCRTSGVPAPFNRCATLAYVDDLSYIELKVRIWCGVERQLLALNVSAGMAHFRLLSGKFRKSYAHRELFSG